LTNDESGLNRLSQTDAISDQDSRVAIAQNREGGLELIRMKVDPAGSCREQPAKWPRVDG